ncbi:hypothetical protein [Leeia aquatica]|uniref:Transmembrane protein n=1 Tax=Leeia aquatica TaxID=2725557 RepID=A0A847SEF8_9NEIS|nr:hypothetical protein [Leeia aquatica]NLR74332.1 hypothetical protein [Leeia aquatica]
MSNTPDLSNDKASEIHQVYAPLDRLGQRENSTLDMLKQQSKHRNWVIGFAMGFAGLLAITFIIFVCRVTTFATSTPHGPQVVTLPASASSPVAVPVAYPAFDWHLLLLGSSLIIPPTIILFILIRRVFGETSRSHSSTNSPNDSYPDTPWGEVLTKLTSIAESFIDLVKKVPPFTGK